MRMKPLLLIIALVALTGCDMARVIRGEVAARGSDASDQTLDTALFTVCKATPIGAINRRFKTDAEKSAYRDVCNLP